MTVLFLRVACRRLMLVTHVAIELTQGLAASMHRLDWKWAEFRESYTQPCSQWTLLWFDRFVNIDSYVQTYSPLWDTCACLGDCMLAFNCHSSLCRPHRDLKRSMPRFLTPDDFPVSYHSYDPPSHPRHSSRSRRMHLPSHIPGFHSCAISDWRVAGKLFSAIAVACGKSFGTDRASSVTEDCFGQFNTALIRHAYRIVFDGGVTAWVYTLASGRRHFIPDI